MTNSDTPIYDQLKLEFYAAGEKPVEKPIEEDVQDSEAEKPEAAQIRADEEALGDPDAEYDRSKERESDDGHEAS